MPILQYQQHSVHYLRYGNGKALLFAFHGFADKADLFESISQPLSEYYTVVAIDLPFHGQSSWNGTFYRPEDIVQIIQLLMKHYGYKRCSLICHSMGGRIVLAVLQSLASRLDRLFFVASAGFQYTFSAARLFFPLWFRNYCHRHFVHSNQLMYFFECSYRLKLMNRATYWVFKQQLDTAKQRERLLKTWISMYYFPMKAGLKELKLLQQHPIKTYFFCADKDRITAAKYSKKFASKLKNTEIVTFEGNHFFVRQHLAAQLNDYLQSNPIEL